MPLVGVLVLAVDAVGAGVLAACSMSAAAVLALPLGAPADRVRRRPLMIIADVAQAVVLTTVPLAAAFDALAFGHLAASRSSCTPAPCCPSWCAAVAGPALGGLLVGVLGATRALLVDAVSFVVNAAALLLIRRPEAPAPRARRRSVPGRCAKR